MLPLSPLIGPWWSSAMSDWLLQFVHWLEDVLEMNICSWYQGLSKTIWILGCRTDDHYPRWLFVGSRTCIQYFSIQNFRPLLLWSWLVLTTVMDIAKYKNRSSPSLDGLRSGGCSGNALAPGMLLHTCLSRRKPTLRSWRKEGICLLL